MTNKKIKLSEGIQIKDPVLAPIFDRCTQLILASINQQLLAKMDDENYKYQPKKLEVNGMQFNTSGSILLKHLKPKTKKDFPKLTKSIVRDTLYQPGIKRTLTLGKYRPSFIVPPVATTKDLKDKESILSNDVLIKKAFDGIAFKKLTKKYSESFLDNYQAPEDPPNLPNPNPPDQDPIDPEIPVQNKGIKFRVHEVKCIDETGVSRFGSDEIAMGGAFHDADGKVTDLKEFRVGGDFDTGDNKRYSPPIVLNSFNIPQSSDTQFYSAFITLAEKDRGGGFSNFLNELYDSIKSEVTAILTGLGVTAGAWVGSQIGGTVGTTVAGPLGALIGMAAGAIVGAVIEAFITSFKDDIFEPQMATIALPSSSTAFGNGSLTSERVTLDFRGHNGYYTVKCDWLITR